MMHFLAHPLEFFFYDNDIRLDTSVAKEEHIRNHRRNGNKLGIMDISVRT